MEEQHTLVAAVGCKEEVGIPQTLVAAAASREGDIVFLLTMNGRCVFFSSSFDCIVCMIKV